MRHTYLRCAVWFVHKTSRGADTSGSNPQIAFWASLLRGRDHGTAFQDNMRFSYPFWYLGGANSVRISRMLRRRPIPLPPKIQAQKLGPMPPL